jgi:hypothetical protein
MKFAAGSAQKINYNSATGLVRAAEMIFLSVPNVTLAQKRVSNAVTARVAHSAFERCKCPAKSALFVWVLVDVVGHACLYPGRNPLEAVLSLQ